MTKKPGKLLPAKNKRTQPNWLSITNIGIAAVVAIAALVIYATWQSFSAQTAKSQPIEGMEQFPGVVQGHKEGKLSYAQTPPAGGEHNPTWQNCGVYTQLVENEYGVHSMEHGAIWITYRPDLAADQVAQLQTLTRQSGYRLLSPYPDLPSPIVATAWGYQLKLETADDERLQRFIAKYEQNPAGPELGAVCTSGVGTPS